MNRLLLATLAGLLLTNLARGQEAPTPPTAKTGAGIQFTVDADEGVGILSAEGSDYYLFTEIARWKPSPAPPECPPAPDAEFFRWNTASFLVDTKVDARWATSNERANYASLRIAPTIAIGRHPTAADCKGTFGAFAFLEGRVFTGDATAEDGTAIDGIKQQLYGAGLGMAWMKDGRQPVRLSAQWHQVNANRGGLPLPDSITANELQATLIVDLPLRLVLEGSRPFGLFATVSGFWPTEGRDRHFTHLVDIQLRYDIEQTGAYKTVLHFRDGKERGVEYDRELLLGLLIQFIQ